MNRINKVSQEAMEIIQKNYPKHGLDKTMRLLKFKGHELSTHQLVRLLNRYGIKREERTLFKKGQVSPTKGKKRSEMTRLKMSRTFFQKGNAPQNTKHIGSEKLIRGYVYVKIAMPSVWKLKHHVIWLQAGKSIPKGYIVVFKDGDSFNFSIENMECISRAENAIRNRMVFLSDKTSLIRSLIKRREKKRAKRRSILIEKYGGLVRAFAMGERL